MKKTEAKITKDTEKQKQMAAECAEIEKDVPALESKKAELEGRVEKEEAALSALLDSLKGEMAEIGAQLDQVQKELAPWEGKLAGAQGAFDVATAERALLQQTRRSRESSHHGARR